MNISAFESKFLSNWEGVDQPDVMCIMFIQATSNRAIGNFPPETNFDYVIFDFDKSIMTVGLNEKETEFNIGVNIIGEHNED